VATGGLPGSAGVPEDITRNTLSIIYNDLSSVERVFNKRGGEIAAVIVEPIAANMGVVLPRDGFLEGLRNLTTKYGTLLIFDEVITGFRVARGGASELYGVIPDLVCLGKILGGGLPTGALGGRGEIMEKLAPLGDVYQAGTLSGNPISVAAGIATLKELNHPALYTNLGKTTELLATGLRERFDAAGIPVQLNWATGLLTVFFSTGLVTDFSSSKASNAGIFCRFFKKMLENNIYLPPSPFEAWFLSTQHGDEETAATLCAAEASIEQIKTTIT
jgi:glutamate-1-semialdehyde 2,1-aminomutase